MTVQDLRAHEANAERKALRAEETAAADNALLRARADLIAAMGRLDRMGSTQAHRMTGNAVVNVDDARGHLHG